MPYLEFINSIMLYNKFHMPDLIWSATDQMYENVLIMRDEDQPGEQYCPVFGVKSGGPIIGLGILIILFGLIPYFLIKVTLPFPIALLFVIFGFFLIWAGISK